MKLLHKRVLITGANQGLGYEIAKQFVREGASVVICARNLSLLKQAHASLLALSPTANVFV